MSDVGEFALLGTLCAPEPAPPVVHARGGRERSRPHKRATVGDHGELDGQTLARLLENLGQVGGVAVLQTSVRDMTRL